MTNHVVSLTVPALPEFLRTARVTASGLANRLGFDLDEVEDLRLALDEMCFALIGKGDAGSDLRLQYSLVGHALAVEGTTLPRAEASIANPTPPAVAPSLGELSEQILRALVDDHRLWLDDDGRHFSFLKRGHNVGHPPQRPELTQ